jgi:hypothetical protein
VAAFGFTCRRERQRLEEELGRRLFERLRAAAPVRVTAILVAKGATLRVPEEPLTIVE